MPTLQDLMAEANSRGLKIQDEPQVDQPTVEQDPASPSMVDQVLQPVKNAIADPAGATGAALRGVEKSFEPPSRVNIPFTDVGFDTGIPDNLTEHIEGTLMFPIIRGAEIAGRLFSNEDNKPEFTSLKQIVGDRIALTQAMQERAPGVMEGTQLGIAVASLPQLVKSGVKTLTKVSPQVWEKAGEVGSKFFNRRTTRLAKDLLREGDGPVLDAIVNQPEKVIDMVKNGVASTDDLAFEIGTQLEKTKTGLGKKVEEQITKFVADPTKKVIITEPVNVQTPTGEVLNLPSPLAVIDEFKQSVTSSDGVSILDSKQESNLNKLEQILKPKAKTVNGVETATGNSIPPKDALLAIKAIDKMVNYETTIGGGVDAQAIQNLLNVRRSLKYQIRGNNADWFKADEDYANFMELQHGLTTKLKESDSAESFLNNIFSNNKERVRERLQEALNYADHVDTNLQGSGDAFYRRLATIRAAKKVKDTQLQVSDPIQDNVNRIVNRYTAGGGVVGSYLSAKAFGPSGIGVGAPVGAYAGYKIGQTMANPMRVLNNAMRAKNLSTKTRELVTDLSYIHKVYGNDGVISLLDIIGPVPAVNELLKMSGTNNKEK